MFPKIKPEVFDNKLYTVKGTKEKITSIAFVDGNFQNVNQMTVSGYSQINMNVYQKVFQLKNLTTSIKTSRYISQDNNMLCIKSILENFKSEINKEIIKKIIDLGTIRRNKNSPEINRKADIINKYKFNFVSNLIAGEGRLGPAQWIISNIETYKQVLMDLEPDSIYSNGQNQMIGNMTYIIDNLVDDDVIILGRKNDIDQPGVHCLLETDETGFVQIYESVVNTDDFSEIKYLTIYYAIADVGNAPEYQYYKLNTKSLNYYRYKKLQKLKELYG